MKLIISILICLLAITYTLQETCNVPNCKTCQNDKCVEAEPGYVISTAGTKTYLLKDHCVKQVDLDCQECEANFQLESTRCTATCKVYVEGCSECENPQLCKACNNDRILSSNKDKCYPKINGCIEQIDLNCLKCSSDYDLNNSKCEIAGTCLKYVSSLCVLCKSGYVLDTTTHLCIKSQCQIPFCNQCDGYYCGACEQGFVLSETKKICMKEIANCQEYNSVTNLCKTCENGYTIKQNGYICYKEYSGTCPANCLRCSDADTCLVCGVGYFIQSAKCFKKVTHCLNQYESYCKECEDGYELTSMADSSSSTSSNQQICVKKSCTTKIANCAYMNEECQCKKCFDSYYLQSNACVQSCSGNYKLNSNLHQCLKCYDSNCDECIGENKFQCIACSNGFTLLDKQCIKQSTTTCSNSEFKLISSGQITCHSACPKDTYANINTKICESCNKIENCLYMGTECQCNVCNANTILSDDGFKCLQECPSGTYMARESIKISSFDLGSLKISCLACQANCKSCKSEQYCSECEEGFQLIAGNCIFKDLIIDECSSTEFKYIENNSVKCVTACPNKYYAEQQECKACSSSCDACDSSGTCTTCASGYKMTSFGECLQKCPVGTAFNTETNICEKCDSSCMSCSKPADKFSCIACGLSKLRKEFLKDDALKAIDENENSKELVKFLVTFKLNTRIKSIISSYKDTQLPGIGLITELANSLNIQIMISEFFNNQEYSKKYGELIENSMEEIKNIDKDGFYAFIKENLSNMETIYDIQKANTKFTCGTTCPSGTFADETTSQCSQCSKECKTCTGYGSDKCTSCWSLFIFENGFCKSRNTATKEIASKGEETLKTEIQDMSNANDLAEMAEKFKQLYSTSNDDGISNVSSAFTSEEIGEAETDEEKKKQQEEKAELAQMKKNIRSSLVNQLTNLTQTSVTDKKQDVSTILTTAEQIVEIDLEEADESEIKKMASLLNQEQITSQTMKNSEISKGFDYLNKIMKIKQKKEESLKSSITDSSSNPDSNSENTENTETKENTTQTKLDPSIAQEIKAGIENLSEGFLKNTDDEPVKVITDSFALNLQKADVSQIKNYMRTKLLKRVKKAVAASEQTDNDETEKKSEDKTETETETEDKKTTTSAEEEIFEEITDLDETGEMQLGEDAITQLEEVFQELEFGDSSNVMINQVILKDDELSSTNSSTIDKKSNVIDFSFHYYNKQNKKEKIAINNTSIDIIMPVKTAEQTSETTESTASKTTQNTKTTKTTEEKCKYFDTTSSNWKIDGVKLQETKAAYYRCRTEHLTEFVVLEEEKSTSTTGTKDSDGGSDSNKTVIISVCCSIAALAVIVGVIVAIYILKKRKHQRERAKITSFSQDSVAIKKL